jgi:large subunit ribosomal protein L16
MLFPKNFKYKKIHHKNWTKVLNFSCAIKIGTFAIKTLKFIRVESKQIQLLSRSISRIVGKSSKFWIYIFPNNTITKKSEKSRMGKGSGNVSCWFYPLLPGDSLIELEFINTKLALKILNICNNLLASKFKLVNLQKINK